MRSVANCSGSSWKPGLPLELVQGSSRAQPRQTNDGRAFFQAALERRWRPQRGNARPRPTVGPGPHWNDGRLPSASRLQGLGVSHGPPPRLAGRAARRFRVAAALALDLARLLFAQVLPLAATLQGLELLHASAVVLDGRTIAFSAPAGTGKTSVAAHLVAGGASLLTDDVLALELSNDGLVAHSGAPVLAVADAELKAMTGDGRARLGVAIGRSDKVIFRSNVVPQARRSTPCTSSTARQTSRR